MKLSNTQSHSGFTLIELMIVVAILGILASIALPSYQEHMRVSRRTDARDALVNVAQRLERQYTATNSYAGGSIVKDAAIASPGGFYDVAATVLSSGAYTLVATAKAPQDKDTSCKTMSMTHTGSKTPAACW